MVWTRALANGTIYWYRGAMSKNTSITIGDELNDFVATQVESGRYGSVSEVIRAGLRLLEEHEAKLRALRTALAEGEQSGTPTEFDFDAFIERKRRKSG